MGIFTDIYNTVAKFFRQSEEPVIGEASKAVAANRLRLVLMQDRTNLTPRVLEQMRSELVDLLSKYLEMDKELLELNFEQEGDQVALMLSIPVIRAKDEEEIEAALAQEEANKKEGYEAEDPESDDENLDENLETEDSDSVDYEECSSEENNENIDSTDELSTKPKRRRPKKVTPPEGMSDSIEVENTTEILEKAEIDG